MRELPEQEYAGTEFGPLTERPLGDGLVTLSGAGSWKNHAGEDIMPFGLTYTMRRTGDEWRIVTALVHAAV